MNTKNRFLLIATLLLLCATVIGLVGCQGGTITFTPTVTDTQAPVTPGSPDTEIEANTGEVTDTDTDIDIPFESVVESDEETDLETGDFESETTVSGESETTDGETAESETTDGEQETKPEGDEIDLVEGEAYKFYMTQVGVGKTLYLNGETDNDKFLKVTTDPKAGLDFFVEKVEGGYKFYAEIGGEKKYLNAETVTSDDGKVSKFLNYAADSVSVYYYKADTNAWFVTIDGAEYVIGTYGTYETASLSASSFMTPDSTGVSQFPLILVKTADVDAGEIPDAPETKPETPAVDKTIPAFSEIAAAQPDKGASTTEKYIVTGTIVEIVKYDYGNMYIADEEGNKLYIYGVYSADGKVRFDSMDPQPKVGDTITVVGVACNYNGPQMKNGWVTALIPGEPLPDGPDFWDEKKDIVTHQSFDELRINDTAEGFFVPGQSAGWDFEETVEENVTLLRYWGWIGIMGEMGQFGYQIDDGEAVYSPDFTHVTEQGVLDAAAGTGADTASRMLINIDISNIAGTHTVTLLYMNAEGVEVILNVFTLTRNVPVDDGIENPVLSETEPYKFYMTQIGVGKTLYLNGETDNDKFLKTTTDPKAGLDFFAEKVEGGYKFYTEIDGAKKYLNAEAVPVDNGISKFLNYTDTTDCIFYYKPLTNAWFVTIDGAEYVIGTYGTYETASLSFASYMTPDSTGVSQFPLELIKSADVGTSTPDTPPEDVVTENTAYKFYLNQLTAGKVLYMTAELDQGKFIKGTTDAKAGLDFFAEKIEGGYKFYTEIDGAKMYLHAHTETNDAGKISKFIGYAAESDNVWYYKAEVNGWFVILDGAEYVLGTYNTYETFSMSEARYLTAENTGKTQFPGNLVLKADAESEDAPVIPDTPDTPDTPDEPAAGDKTIVEFNEIASAQPDKGDATSAKYTVSGKITEIKNTQYGNMYIEDEAGNKLYIYGVYSADGKVRFDAMNPQPKVGDTITITGVACSYNGPQMKNGWVLKLNGNDYVVEEPETEPAPELPSGEAASIDFKDTANRTVGTTEQQVWVMNGVTVTNNKGGATSNVNTQYNDPIRCYKGSDLEIAYTGMKKIVIVCNTADYAGVLAANTPNAGSIAADGNIVTITLDSATDKVSFTGLSAQVRIDMIRIYTA